MGALGNSGDSRIFVNTFNGSFTTKAKEGDEGAIKRTNKNNTAVWENRFNVFKDVFIQDIKRHDSEEYGFSWDIFLAHSKSDEAYTLNFPYSSRITMGLFFSLPNLDIDKPFFLHIGLFKDDKSNTWLYQDGKKIERKWFKDNMGDMPDMEEIMKDGKKVWDSTKRMAYIEKYLASDIIPKLRGTDTTQQESTKEAPKETKSAIPAKPEWDAEAQCLKLKHEDGNYYECDEKGVFKRDQKGELISALPF